MNELHSLAEAVGLEIDWRDAAGSPQHVSDDSLRAVLAALGYPADSELAVSESLRACRAEAEKDRFVSALKGADIVLPQCCANARTALLELEDGTVRTVALEPGADGAILPGIAQIGYHLLRGEGFEVRLAVAPSRCLGAEDLADARRLWGPAVQIPSLRGEPARSFGDFATLALAARRFGEAGADAIAISPTHALFPADPSRYSPYGPSSRQFLNILYADPALVGTAGEYADPDELIDWERAIPARLETLRRAYAQRSDATDASVRAYREELGEPLERHATFDALHAHFFADGARGWPDWPSDYHDPSGAAVARFARQHRSEIDFFVFAQWLAATSLDRAQAAAREAGMAVGLIADLAVGMDGGGSHAWSRPDELLTGLSVGAPPDLLGPDGQDWGLTTFSPQALKRTGFEPFIATLRAALDHAGGIRIDHALGLQRLWVIPHGSSPAQGAYLRYPLGDMLRVLAIESHRAGAIVIGEDLGTVPDGLRPRLEANHVLGMRVLQFERDGEGGYAPPGTWQAQAVAMSSTHDLPTIAGWWQGRDIDWTWKLGRSSGFPDEAAAREHRVHERDLLWQALVASGAASGPVPAPEDSGPVVDAALAQIGITPCELAIVPLEDIVGLIEQPNLPGTIDEHPNWRRRMPATLDALLGRSEISRRLAMLIERRS